MEEDQVVAGHAYDNDVDDESFFQDIDLLQNHGINVADIKKLKSVGICTIKVQCCLVEDYKYLWWPHAGDSDDY